MTMSNDPVPTSSSLDETTTKPDETMNGAAAASVEQPPAKTEPNTIETKSSVSKPPECDPPPSSTMNGHAKQDTTEPAVPDTTKEVPAATNGHAKADPNVEEQLEEAVDTPDEEENLFIQMEEEQHKHEEPVAQPKQVEAAPKLLQKALQNHEVNPDESEEESDKEVQKKEDAEPHYHQRVRCTQLVFCCCLYCFYDIVSNAFCFVFCFFPCTTGQSIGLFVEQGVRIQQFYRQGSRTTPRKHAKDGRQNRQQARKEKTQGGRFQQEGYQKAKVGRECNGGKCSAHFCATAQFGCRLLSQGLSARRCPLVGESV